MYTIEEIAARMDHTLLHPTAGRKELLRECQVAIENKVAALCIKPYMVEESRKILDKSGVKTCCVVGFPSGNASISSKAFEAKDAALSGAQEVDMVINVAKALEGEWDYLRQEIAAVTEACHDNGAIVKVIIETDYLETKDQIVRLCEICVECEADFIKTSTGFGYKKNAEGQLGYIGATIEDISLMKESLQGRIKVKASGGIRDLDTFITFMDLGCERIGLSATESILEEAKNRK